MIYKREIKIIKKNKKMKNNIHTSFEDFVNENLMEKKKDPKEIESDMKEVIGVFKKFMGEIDKMVGEFKKQNESYVHVTKGKSDSSGDDKKSSGKKSLQDVYKEVWQKVVDKYEDKVNYNPIKGIWNAGIDMLQSYFHFKKSEDKDDKKRFEEEKERFEKKIEKVEKKIKK